MTLASRTPIKKPRMMTSLWLLVIGASHDEMLFFNEKFLKEWPGLTIERVDCVAGLSAALENQTWDCVVCDTDHPGFDPFQAFEAINKSGQRIPFVVVSGDAKVKDAISFLKAGAHDVVQKD